MKKILSRLSSLLLSLPVWMMAVVPAYAAGAGIQITPGSGGITIKPGAMPDMTDVSGIKSAVDELVMPQVRSVAMAITSICTIICFVAFLISVTKLSTSAGNPAARQRALTGILVSGVALALFGGAFIVVGFFWNFLAP